MPSASTLAPALTRGRTEDASQAVDEQPTFQIQEQGRSQAQHMRALARANRVRLARASLKRAIGSGHRSAAEVVLTCPWEAESMTTSELLTSQHRWGGTRARKFLNELKLREDKILGSLTNRQRMLLAGALQAKCGGVAAEPA